jgi:hypothetical protein
MTKTQCEQREMLKDYVNNQLTTDQELFILKHAITCTPCRNRIIDLSWPRGLLQMMLENHEK